MVALKELKKKFYSSYSESISRISTSFISTVYTADKI